MKNGFLQSAQCRGLKDEKLSNYRGIVAVPFGIMKSKKRSYPSFWGFGYSSCDLTSNLLRICPKPKAWRLQLNCKASLYSGDKPRNSHSPGFKSFQSLPCFSRHCKTSDGDVCTYATSSQTIRVGSQSINR